jgi:peroxiredoxin Q/BCP
LEFSELKSEFESLGAVVLGISPDSLSSHETFRQKHNISVLLLSNPDLMIIDTFNAWGRKIAQGRESFGVTRSTVLIDPKGIVRIHWPKVHVQGHAADVLKSLGKVAVQYD